MFTTKLQSGQWIFSSNKGRRLTRATVYSLSIGTSTSLMSTGRRRASTATKVNQLYFSTTTVLSSKWTCPLEKTRHVTYYWPSTYRKNCYVKSLPSLANSFHDVVLYDNTLAHFRPQVKCFCGRRPTLRACRRAWMNTRSPTSQTWRCLVLLSQCGRTSRKCCCRRWRSVFQPRPSRPDTATLGSPPSYLERSAGRGRRRGKQERPTRSVTSVNKRVWKHRLNMPSDKPVEPTCKTSLATTSPPSPTASGRTSRARDQESAGVSPLNGKDGFLKRDCLGKAEIPKNQFKSVFTEEDATSIAEKRPSPYPDKPSIMVSEASI